MLFFKCMFGSNQTELVFGSAAASYQKDSRKVQLWLTSPTCGKRWICFDKKVVTYIGQQPLDLFQGPFWVRPCVNGEQTEKWSQLRNKFWSARFWTIRFPWMESSRRSNCSTHLTWQVESWTIRQIPTTNLIIRRASLSKMTQLALWQLLKRNH